tara:strand:- start:204 stop:1295 length:1092 start_codon:yes stop_codon:yes gene_type:complete
MSLKINKSHKKYMDLAISLAEERVGLTGTNPSVGCVIVKNNEIISVGQTGIGGVPHAETVAIRNTNKNKLKNSTMYVTLEPCNHYGKTPPCTKQIIKSKIKKVYYGIEDIDIRTSGKSKKIFNSHKIIVKKNLQFKKIKKLYKSYFFLKNKKYPYTTGKIACTNDYFIKSTRKYISNCHSLKFSHLLRYKNQGILVSSKTINSDNSLLNCRLNGLEVFSPTRIILDKNLKIKTNSKVIKTSNKIKTYIFYNSTSPKIKKLKRMGVKFIRIQLDDDNNLDMFEILKIIKKLNIFYLLVEGGIKLTNFFITKKLFNEFYLLKSNISVKNKKNFKKYRFQNTILKLFSKNETINTFIDNDKIIKYF